MLLFHENWEILFPTNICDFTAYNVEMRFEHVEVYVENVDEKFLV